MTVGNVPYCLVFGQMPRVGISSLHLSVTVLDTLATEAQLNQVCDYVGKVVIPDDNFIAVGEDVENKAQAIDDPVVVGKDEGEEAVANNILWKKSSRATPATLLTMTTVVKGKEFQWPKS